MSADTFRIAGSTRAATVAAKAIEPVDPGSELTVTVHVRRNPAIAPARSPLEQASLPHASRRYLDDDQAALLHSADAGDLDAVVTFAGKHHLKVVERSAPKRLVRLHGTAKVMDRAFGVKLMHYEHPSGAKYRSHAEEVELPIALAGIVEGVLGLDNRKMARSYLRAARKPKASAGQVPPDTYLPPQVAGLFDFPATLDGSGECVAVFAFNGQVMSTGQSTQGGYDATAVDGYFTKTVGQAAPALVDVVVQGPGNDPGDGSNPDDATGEVLLDLCIVGSVAPKATIAVYFTEFTEDGWVNAIKAAVADTTNKPSVISISYGNPEDDAKNGLWTEQAVKLVNDSFQQAANQGMTICVASGDNGAPDEPSGATDHVDFPASSPWVLAVGGTRLEADPAAGTISREVVWNDLAQNEGATGGGVSRLFGIPSWQSGAGVPDNADGSGSTGRGVPDVASLADPQTAFNVLSPDGTIGQVGGTSAAAPMWSALVARINQGTGARLGFFNSELYARVHGSLRDITQGNNGGYSAGPGWDACTGWGRPNGAKLLAALTPTASPTPTPQPVPTPPPASPPTTLATGGFLFGQPSPGPDATTFQVDNTSAGLLQLALLPGASEPGPAGPRAAHVAAADRPH